MQIELRALSQTFGAIRLFAGLNATLDPGKIHAIVGPSGSGKSTLLEIISGMRQPSSGEVVFRFGSHTSAPIAQEVAWIPQIPAVLPARTSFDNVALAPRLRGLSPNLAGQRTLDALTQVGLTQHVHTPVRLLSGGEVQRVCIARALASGRAVILADEPTASLDRAGAGRIAELLRSLTRDQCVIVATHDPLVMDSTDRIIDLNDWQGFDNELP